MRACVSKRHAEARQLDPGAIGVWEDFGGAGPIHEEFLTGRWALAERIAIDEAHAILAGSGGERSHSDSQAPR